jgi:hypothetical protein
MGLVPRTTKASGSGSEDRARTRDVLGVPALPPAAVTGFTERMRAGLGGLHRSTAPPPIQVLEGIFGVLDHAVLGALCTLEVPDRLDGPMAVDALARSVDADPDVVRRLVAYAAARGWLRLDRKGRVRSNRTTAFLRRDHPGGWRAWVDFATGEEVTSAVARLARDPRAPDAFEAANGASFFDWYVQHPDRHRAFDGAMAAGGRMHGLVLADAVDWERSERVCDVGGGSGALLRVLLDAQPHLHGVLFDLPDVVAHAEPHDRLDQVGGDAFEGVPSGCDTYLFVNVLHDWDDDDCVRLLEQARSAGGEGTTTTSVRVVVVEGERRERPHDGIAVRTDVLMLALAPGGKERTTGELTGLAERAGLHVQHTVALASGDNAHVLLPT